MPDAAPCALSLSQYIATADLQASQGKYAEAVTAFTAAVEAVPADTLHTAHFNLANAHRKLAAATRTDAEGRDHYRHAVVADTALVQAEPTNWRARVNLGATHLAAGDAKLATRTLRPALALAQRIDVYDVLKGAKRIARGRAGRLRRLLVPGYTPSRLAGAAAAGDRRRFAKAGYVCEDLLDQVNLAFLAQLTPMLRQDAFSTHGLLGVAAAANESGLRGAASRARVEALLRGMLSAMPAERFAACMRALSDGLLCHVATAALAGGKGGDSDDLDLGMLLAALSLLAREPGEVCSRLRGRLYGRTAPSLAFWTCLGTLVSMRGAAGGVCAPRICGLDSMPNAGHFGRGLDRADVACGHGREWRRAGG